MTCKKLIDTALFFATLFAIAAILLIPATALATDTPKPPKPRQVMTQQQHQQAVAQAVAAALAKAKAEAAAKSSSTSTSTGGAATGGNATGGNAAGGSNSLGDLSTNVAGDASTYDSWSLGLPPLASTPSMAPIVGCAPEITQSAFGALFGALSSAAAKTDPQDCTLMALRNTKVEQCQYASAKQIEDLMLVKKLPDFKPSANTLADLDQATCRTIKNPPPPAAAPVAAQVKPEIQYETRYIYLDPPAPKVPKKVVKKPSAVTPPCEAGVLVCTPTGTKPATVGK